MVKYGGHHIQYMTHVSGNWEFVALIDTVSVNSLGLIRKYFFI